MGLSDVEKAFSRAFALCFSKKKMLLTFAVLLVCGIFSVFCRALALHAGQWVSMSLVFLPLLLSFGILLALGVVLVRAHVHEVKKLSLQFRRLITGSLDLIFNISYLAAAPVLVYLFLWILLGFFFLLREIPGIGDFFSVALSFGPFLLAFSFLILCLSTLSLLFFAAPAVVFQGAKKPFLSKWWKEIKEIKILSSCVLFLLGLLPALIITIFLFLAASLVETPLHTPLSSAFYWFFVMIPSIALLTPAVIFFFNFGAESYELLRRR